ncbi:MAG TPA: tape measure protein [Bacillota bacterium]|nr:tape measure protein [Bacillota bacterium]
MAEREFYRLDLVINTTGDEQTKGKLKAMDRFIEQTRKRGEMLNRMRMSPAVQLIDRISAPLRTVERNLNRLSAVKKVTIEAVDRTTNVVRRITGALTSPLAMLGAGAGVAGLIGYPLKLAGEMEQANIAMETMLGSTEKAQKFLSDLADFAVKTPFEMPQLRDASRRLLAFGFSAESVIPTLTALGDAASGLGLGEEGLNRIVLALGQMRAKAKVSGEEMLQLTEAGIPAWDILSKKMGMATADVMKLSEKGLIPASEAIDMLVSGMEERFPNMMEKQSRSLFGLLSTLKDFANLKFFWAFGEGIRQAAVPALQKFIDMLSGNEEGMKKVQERLTELGRTVGTWVVDKFEAFYRWVEKLSNDEMFNKMSFGDKLIYVLNQGLDAVSNWLNGEGGNKLQAISAKVGEILSVGLEAMAPSIAKAAIAIGKAIGSAILSGFGEALQESFLGSIILGALGGAAIGSVVPGVGTAAGAVAGAGSGLITYGASKVMGVFSGEKHATGGIFTRPHLGLVAEAGPEAVIPLSAKLRPRALNLYQETGKQLGVQSYATGGFAGPIPAMPAAAGAGNTVIVYPQGSISIQVNNQEINYDALALEIGWRFVKPIKQALENR